MKKIRIVILTMTAFSLFCSLFFNLSYIIYDKVHDCGGELIKAVSRPVGAHFIAFLVIFALTLIWYLYHKKDRAESITNFLILALFLAYLGFFIYDIIHLENFYKEDCKIEAAEYLANNFNYAIWHDFSLVILIAPGAWILVSIIPTFFHFVASVCTGGFDNVPEPDNIYGFMFTVVGICYLLTMILIGLTSTIYEITSIFSLNGNGLIISVMILTFILCAGLRFNSIFLNIFNIFMNHLFIIIWFIILIYNRHYNSVQIYYIMYHFIFIIPMAVLSVFIFKHYIRIDRFYKGRTKNFLNE